VGAEAGELRALLSTAHIACSSGNPLPRIEPFTPTTRIQHAHGQTTIRPAPAHTFAGVSGWLDSHSFAGNDLAAEIVVARHPTRRRLEPAQRSAKLGQLAVGPAFSVRSPANKTRSTPAGRFTWCDRPFEPPAVEWLVALVE